MSSELNKTNVLRIPLEVFNQGNLAAADEVMAPDYIAHAPARTIGGVASFKAFAQAFRTAFPDLHYTIDDVLAEGDRVVVRATVHGTHQGAFMGMPATGKSATWSEIHIARLNDGKVVEHWVNQDRMGMLQQLGVIPAPKGA